MNRLEELYAQKSDIDKEISTLVNGCALLKINNYKQYKDKCFSFKDLEFIKILDIYQDISNGTSEGNSFYFKTLSLADWENEECILSIEKNSCDGIIDNSIWIEIDENTFIKHLKEVIRRVVHNNKKTNA